MQNEGKKERTEVEAVTKRRRHTLFDKLKGLETVSELRSQGNGALGAYLRKEGLYYSSIRKWVRVQSDGNLSTNRRGTKQTNREEPLAENKQLEKRLKKTELTVELQEILASPGD